MRTWRLLAVVAVLLAIAGGSLVPTDPAAEAQGAASHLGAWSDAPNRIIVHWGDTTNAESYARGFAKGEEYIVRWKRADGTLWGSADSKNDVPNKYGRTASVATAGGASVGDPDLVITLPESDRSPGNVLYDIELYQSDPASKNQCLTPGIVDLSKCKLVGFTSVKTNTSKTVGGTGASGFFRGFGSASPMFDIRAAPQAQTPSGTMYATSTQSDSTYTVNLTTGAFTLVGSTGVGTPNSMAWDGTTMFGVGSHSASTYTVNLETGGWTRVGATGTGYPVGLAWNGSTMYGTDSGSADMTYTVNRTTGRWTALGDTGRILPSHMGWDGSTMYGVDAYRNTTNTVDLTTGAWTLLGPTQTGRPTGMDWTGATMYGVDGVAQTLYTVNRTTGLWSEVGGTGVSFPSALAWVPNASADATLSALALSAGTLTPAFATGTTTYTAAVEGTVTSITVTPTASRDAATITVDGTPTTSASPSASISLTPGDNQISVVVTAEDGNTTQTYTVTVTRERLSTDATLSGLILSMGTLDPPFDAATTRYTADVEDTVTSITITATASDATATITVDGTPTTNASPSASISLTEGENALLVVVTAEDRSTTETYTVTVSRDTAAGTPGRVPKPTVSSSERQMTVSWLEPDRIGASAITGYDVQFSRGANPYVGSVASHGNINHDHDHGTQ